MGHQLLMEVQNLKVTFPLEEGRIRAVDDVRFSLYRGKTLGLVGESGCGKSITGLSLLQLVPKPGRIEGGKILYYRPSQPSQPLDIASLPPGSDLMREIRGGEIAMIFQEPMTSLNPVYTIGEQIIEGIRLHQKVQRKEAREKAIEMLNRVGVPAPHLRVDEYPHQLSGGLRQRAMIAMALSCQPFLLIADEPTTALDVTVQAQILDLLRQLQEEMGMAILFISHDLGVIAEISKDVVVMYAGRVVESGPVEEIFHEPLHPYTQGLLKSIPILGSRSRTLWSIRGSVPHPLALPKGCPFRPRCDQRMPACFEPPSLKEVKPGHWVSCWLYE